MPGETTAGSLSFGRSLPALPLCVDGHHRPQHDGRPLTQRVVAGLWLCDSTLEWYVGSSGALHGVMAAGALAHLRRGERDGALLSVALVAKLGYEHWAGALPFSASLPVVVSAHLYGVMGGSAVAVFVRPRARSAVGPSL